MLQIRFTFFSVVLTMGASGIAIGNTFYFPPPRIFSSGDGYVSFKVLPVNSYEFSTGMLFSLHSDGKEKIIWKRKLVNLPFRAIIYDGDVGKPATLFDDNPSWKTYIVTIGSWASEDHPIVVYGRKGKLVRNFETPDLLSKKEIRDRLDRRAFKNCAEFDFVEYGQLRIEFYWGKRVMIDLPSGTIWNSQSLKKFLQGKDRNLRWRAASALKYLSLDAKEALPTLIATLKDEEDYIRRHVVTAIGELRPRTTAAVKPLIKALNDKQFGVRINAAKALGKLGPVAKAAIPALQIVSKLEDPSDPLFGELPESAIKAIRRISPNSADKKKW